MSPAGDETLFDPLVTGDKKEEEEEGLTTGRGGGSALLGGLMSLEGPVQPVMEPVQPVLLTSSSVPPANIMQVPFIIIIIVVVILLLFIYFYLGFYLHVWCSHGNQYALIRRFYGNQCSSSNDKWLPSASSS